MQESEKEKYVQLGPFAFFFLVIFFGHMTKKKKKNPIFFWLYDQNPSYDQKKFTYNFASIYLKIYDEYEYCVIYYIKNHGIIF